MQYLFLIPYLIAGCGLFFLILSPGILKRWARFMRESIVVEGTVISVRRVASAGEETYGPVIEFPDGKGNVVQSASAGYSYSQSHWQRQIGRKLPVRLIPGEPDTAQVDVPLLIYMPLLIVLVFGVGFTVVGGTLSVLQLAGLLVW